MKLQQHIIVLILGALCVSLSSCSVQQRIKRADKKFAIGEYFEAADIYKQCYSRLSTKKDRDLKGYVAFRQGECYRLINNPRAANCYQSALRCKYHLQDSIIFLNAGDAFASDTVLARLAQLTSGNPGVIYGQTQLVDQSREVVGERHLTAPKRLTVDSFLRGMVVCHQAFVVRRDLAPEYDLQYRLSADYDWCIRVLKASPANAYAGRVPIISYLADGMTTRHHRASLLERYRIMCHHYGTMKAILAHLSFIPRFVKRRIAGSPNSQ